MPDITDTAAYSIQLQLAFYFCLFGFVSTIISTSVFLKWQQHKLNTQKQIQHIPYPIPSSSSSCSNINITPPIKPIKQSIPNRSFPLLPPKVPLKHPYHIYNNTQIILDWDDTLFPTAYTLLNMKNGKTNSNSIDSLDWTKLNQLTKIIYNLLLQYIQLFGAHNICIVTNAKYSWYNESCLMYKQLYNKIHNLLTAVYNIQIISAYDIYHKQKSCAFMDILYNKHNISQVICIGDSDDEYNAIHYVINILQKQRNINYYRFKLLQSPSLNAMIKQLYSIQQLDYNIITQQTYDKSYQFR